MGSRNRSAVLWGVEGQIESDLKSFKSHIESEVDPVQDGAAT